MHKIIISYYLIAKEINIYNTVQNPVVMLFNLLKNIVFHSRLGSHSIESVDKSFGADWISPVSPKILRRIDLLFCFNACKDILLDRLLGNPPNTAIPKAFELTAV